jgi:hypothetical protein
VFFQAKNAYCLLKVALSLLRGETKNYRMHLDKLWSVISLRRFIATCTNVKIDLRMDQQCPTLNDDEEPNFETPNAYSKIFKNNHKARASMGGDLKIRRLKNPAAHEMVTTHDAARVPQAFVNKTPRCVVCCYKCYDAKGHVKHRNAYPRGVPKGARPTQARIRARRLKKRKCSVSHVDLCHCVRK